MEKNTEELQFQAKLKDIYKSQDKIAQLIEGLDKIPQQSMKDYYVKLQTIIREDNDNKKHGNYEDISGEKKEIELTNLFEKLANDEKEPHKLLVLGGAGVGKTTILQYIAYKWSVGELWADKFDYVYRASLKSLLNTQWTSSPWAYEPHQRNGSLLKCLIHHTLCLTLSYGEIKKLIPPERLPWGENKRTLLLLDGYDEIAHLANDDDYKRIEEEIFEHDFVIMTSRPNAVNKMLKEKFDRKLENIGLDNSGIEQYFRQYFRETPQKGADLQKFLTGNSVIKSICKIPVNIAMLCYIWSESESSEKLNEISRVSSLYQEVVSQLGRRYFAKQYKGEKVEGYRLEEKLENGQFILDELKVLTYTAYNSMTGGGIKAASGNDNAETLIIRGCLDNPKDEKGISVQSSINFLASNRLLNDDQRRKTTVADVYKYGLLKVEGAVTTLNEKAAPDFLKQTYSFIHLTFQECLTANYLKELLKNGTEQEKTEVCGYIADRRNEPRYLMTLKFMAGIITNEESDPADKENRLQTMFWDAMSCNIDGLIELGIETKISLLMHLLSQAKVKGTTIDPRISHKEEIINLIDAVVLSDLVNWSSQLKESDYMSENIKEGMIFALSEDYLHWYYQKIEGIQAKSSQELQAAIKTLVQAKKTKDSEKNEGVQTENTKISAVELINMFFVKFNQKELLTIVSKLENIISQHKVLGWHLVGKAVEALKRILAAVEGLKSIDEGLISMKSLSELLSNSNLSEVAEEAISTIFQVTLDSKEVEAVEIDSQPVNKTIIFLFKILALTNNEKIKVSITQVIVDIRKTAKGNKESAENALKTIFDILRKEIDSSVPDIVELLVAAVGSICQVVKEEEKLLAQAVNETSKLFQRYPEKELSQAVVNTLDVIRRATKNEKIKEASVEKLQEWAANNPTDPLGISWQQICALQSKCWFLVEKDTSTGIIELADLLFKELIMSTDVQSEEVFLTKCGTFNNLAKSPRYAELELALSQKIFSTIPHKDNRHIDEAGLFYITSMICFSLKKNQERIKEFYNKLASLLNDNNAEVLSLTLNTIYRIIPRNEDYCNFIFHFFEKIAALLSHKDKQVKLDAIKSMGAMSRQFTRVYPLQVRFGLPVLVHLADLFSNPDEEIVASAIDTIHHYFPSEDGGSQVSNEEERKSLIQLLDKVANLVSHNNTSIQKNAFNSLQQIVNKYMTDEKVRKHTFTIFSNFFLHEDEFLRNNSVETTGRILNQGLDSDLEAIFLEKSKELLSNNNVTTIVLGILLRSIKKAGGKDLAPQNFQDAVDLINSLDESGIKRNVWTIINYEDNDLITLVSEKYLNFLEVGPVTIRSVEECSMLAKRLRGNDFTTRVLNKLTRLLANKDGNARIYCLGITYQIELTKDKKLAADIYREFFVPLDQQNGIVGALDCAVALICSAQDKQLAVQALTEISQMLFDRVEKAKHISNNTEKYKDYIDKVVECVEGISSIVRCFKDREMTAQGLKDLLRVLEESPKNNDRVISKISRIATKTFSASSDDILKCLKHPLESLRRQVGKSLSDTFRALIEITNSIEKAMKDVQDINKLFIQRAIGSLEHLLPWEIYEDTIRTIENHINTFKANKNATPKDLLMFKESVIYTLNRVMKGHEFIEIALTMIGYDEPGAHKDNQRRELIELARKVLKFQIKCLDEQGLKWITSNVEVLASLSGESKLLFKRLYHKLLDDKRITPVEKDLIIKFINQGLTTSISRKGEIILEGKKYVIEGENIMSMLEEIARAVIDQEKDVLAIQYKTHMPIFPKSMNSGIKKASSDIKTVYSVVDKSYQLSSSGWLLTKLKGAAANNNNNDIVLLEQRSAIGDHLVFQVDKKNMIRIIPDGASARTELEEIFRKQHSNLNRKYSGNSVSLSNQEATQIISGSQSLDDYNSKISQAQTKSYFLDELLGEGNQDRLSYLEEELGNKLTDHEKAASSAFKKNDMSSEDQAKLKEYYKAFIGTFASVYTTSQVIDSGQVTLKVSNTAASLLSALASFAPFIGGTLSTSITSIAEFLKSQEMLKNARKMKNLASDAVSLNQLIGECAYQIVLNPKKQKKILSITDEELQKISGSLIEKITKFCQNMGEKVDEYLYSRMYSTTAAKLGNNDANEIIQAWIKGDINPERIQEQAINTATGQKSKDSASPSKAAKEREDIGGRRSACCQLF